MFRLFLAATVLVFLMVDANAKAPGICEGIFVNAAKVKSKTIQFKTKQLACRSLRDGPKGFQLQCFSKRDVRVAADRIATGLSGCLTAAGFSEATQGQSERMKITELRNAKHGILCTLINSAKEAGPNGWTVKMKCFGPR
jgi:hypothetical protein